MSLLDNAPLRLNDSKKTDMKMINPSAMVSDETRLQDCGADRDKIGGLRGNEGAILLFVICYSTLVGSRLVY